MHYKLFSVLLTTLVLLTVGWILLADPPGSPSWAAPPAHPMQQSLPDVAVTKYIESGTPAPGQEVKYVIHFMNWSFSSASNIHIRDTLPVSSTYVTSSGPGLTLYQAGPDQVIWYKNYLTGFEQGWASITVRFDNDVPASTIAENIVYIETFTPESNFDNNEYVLRSQIVPADPDLTIRKELQSGIVDGGNEISYHIHYQNKGTSALSNVRITDTLPVSATYVSDVNATGFTTVLTGSTVVWEKALVAGQEEGDLYVNVLIDDGFDPSRDWLENVVEISTTDTETNYDNNLNRFTVKPEDDKFYGAAVTSVDDKTMQLLSEGGIDWMIYYLDWSTAEPNDNQYDWTDLDSAIWQAWRYHRKLAVRIDRAPAWARSVGSDTAPPASDDSLRDFLQTLAGRTDVPPIDAYIIWNEPNLADEWGGLSSDAEDYADLLCAAYKGVKAGNANALVVSAGLATTNGGPDSIDDRTFLQSMYTAGAGSCFDLLGVNPMGFASAPDDTSDPNSYNFSRALDLRSIMENNGDSGKNMFATEVGWLRDTSIDLGSDYNWMKVSDIDQAHYLTRAFHKARREWPWMQTMMAWNMDFGRFYTDTAHPHWFSVTDKNREPHRAYLTLKNAATSGPADLWLEKELVSEALPGQNLVYHLHVNNIGGQSADSVVLTDTIPVGATYESDSRGGASVNGSEVTWPLGNLVAGARESITLTLHLSNTVLPGSVLTNTAEVTTLPTEPYVDDNTAQVVSRIENIIVSPITLTVSEPNGSDSFIISLSSLPTAPVTVSLSTSNSECSVPASVVLNGSNWDDGVDATVQAIDDDISEGNHTCIVQTAAGSADPRYNDILSEDVVVTIIDDDPMAFLPIISKNYVPPIPGPDLIVERIIANRTQVQVVIRNQGDTTVAPTDEFWVDLYVNPGSVPVYNQTWPLIAHNGAAWGVTAPALPLTPGGIITLTTGGQYYWPSRSDMDWPLSSADQIYAQVDSANTATSYGAVQESNESNNVSGAVNPAGLDSGMTSEKEAEIPPQDITRILLPPRP